MVILMKGKNNLIACCLGLLFSTNAFSAYYLHVTNLAPSLGTLHTLNKSTYHEKVIDPSIYLVKMPTVVKFFSTSSIISSGTASITIGTEDNQHYCKFHMRRYTNMENRDKFSELEITESKNAHCDLSRENSNTSKLFISE